MGKFDSELSDSFEYLKCCFFEALRIESPVPQSTPTTFYQDAVINGVLINAYDQVGIAIDYMQRDPVQWQQPDQFIPERFDPESPFYKRPDGGVRHPLAFGAFLGGQRVCLGKTFAEVMVRFTISIVLYHYSFEIIDRDLVENKPPMNSAGREQPTIMCKKTKRHDVIFN